MSDNLLFYSSNDFQRIDDNLDQIETEATKKSYVVLDPTNTEYSIVKKIILDFIKEQKRIIYGGSAYHTIIQNYRKDKNDTNTIYPEWERYDVEFYSPNPIRDLVMICNRIHDAGIKYVIGRQAQHDETFTVFANFLQYCDMSYMPEIVFNNIQVLEIGDIKYIHPEVILIDIFRMFNDPLTSYWRLNKVYKRMKLLLNKFPYDFKKSKPVIFDENKDNHNLINYIVPLLISKNDKILFTGQLAYLVYINPDKSIPSDNISQIEIITDDIESTSKYITDLTYKWLNTQKKLIDYDKLFTIKKYSRFFQFWDKRIIIYYKNNPLFTIIGSANRCLPFINSQLEFNSSKLDIKIGTFLVTFNYFFIGYQYELINKQGFYFKNRNIIDSLLTKRNEYLKSNNKTVLDSTIYKEFVIDCIGKTTDFSREFMLRMSDKRAKGERGLMSYDPNIARGNFIEYKFEQADGLENN
jgi:hypothetical protein